MLTDVLGNLELLTALGWALANNLWQAGLCWLTYRFITLVFPASTATFKHTLSLILMGLSFAWLIVTGVQYRGEILVIELLPRYTVTIFVQMLLVICAVFYLLMLALRSRQLIRAWLGIRQLFNETGQRVPAEIRIFSEQMARQMGISKKIIIRISEQVEVPSVIGFLKPLLLLPVSACTQLNPSQLEAVILHELAHIRRNDYLLNLIQSIIETLLFFNPFVILLGKEARKERENSCDDWVLNYDYNRQTYAAALLKLEACRSNSVRLTMTATGNKGALLQRIKRLFVANPEVRLSRPQIRLLSFAASVMLILFIIARPIIDFEDKKNQFHPSTDFSTILMRTDNKQTNQSPVISHNQVPINKMEAVISSKKKKIRMVAEKRTIPLTERGTSIAFINESILAEKSNQSGITLPIYFSEGNQRPILVKVEEEQSGNTQKTTYVIEMKNNRGITTLQPLLILRKHDPVNRIIGPNKLPGTQSDSLKNGMGQKKKGITS